MSIIREKMLHYIDNSFVCDETKLLAKKFVDFQTNNRSFLFGELTILHYEMLNGKGKDILSVAASIELLVLSADILDDIQDQDNFSAPWHKVKQEITINIATALLLLSKQIIDNVNAEQSKGISDLFYTSIYKSISGQNKDLHNERLSEHEYISLIKMKSGSLTALACLMGSYFAEHTITTCTIEKYGELLGVIAQIYNDLRDLLSFENKNDIKNKKVTFPIIYMLSMENNLLKNYYNNLIDYKELVNRKEEMLLECEKLGMIHYTRVFCEFQKQEALDLLGSMDVNQSYKKRLAACFI